MAMRVKPETGEVGPKQRYRVTNWSEYDQALVNRGNLTIWFDDATIREQWTPPPPEGRGKPGLYSETAIQTYLTIKALFQLPDRATEGLVRSLMRLCQLDLPVPDHTHMSRRAVQLSVKVLRRPRQGPTPVVVDSTDLKIFGEGEWAEAGLREATLRAARAGRLCKVDRGTVRQHGVSKRRTWRKIPLTIDETSQDIIGIKVTTPAWGDGEVLPGLLDQVEDEIAQVSAEGAYDSHGCHATIAKRNARATLLPPSDGAVAWEDGYPRDVILQEIEAKGLARWKNDCGYHRRSLAENIRYRLKQLGDRLYSRTFERQVNGAHIRVTILNTFTDLGVPKSIRVGQVAPAARKRTGKEAFTAKAKNLAL